jgi:hypothetical protein
MQIDYTSKRSLKAGHTVDTEYMINIGVEVFDKQPRWEGVLHKSLSGNLVTTTHEYGDDLSITTVQLDEDPTAAVNIYDMREFLDSVRLGEVFQLDGLNAVLSNLSSAYSETHTGYVYKKFSFQVRIL